MARFKNPPQARHPALQPLSRDHYVGLVQARRLITAAQGSDVDRRAAVAGFVDAWETEIAEHFDDEERMLVPLADQAHADRLRDEHARLRRLADEARQQRRQTNPDPGWVRTLGESLNDHIRWEERELFPAIQKAASPGLQALEPEAERIEASRARHGTADQNERNLS